MSTLTRVKPNAFNYLFQIMKKVKLHASDPRTQNDAFRAASTDYGLSRAEHDAVENLLLHISPPARDFLTRLGSTYGMVKGPISHQGIASKALRATFMVKTEIGFYEDKLNNDEETVNLILERIKLDFLHTAAGMRTSASDEKVHSLQKVSRMFLLYCEDLRTKLTLEAHHVEPLMFHLESRRPLLLQASRASSFIAHYDQAYLVSASPLLAAANLILTGLRNRDPAADASFPQCLLRRPSLGPGGETEHVSCF